VALAKRLSGLDEKSFAFKVLLAKSAIEALTVVVVVQGLDPSVAGLNGKAAGDALRCEQLVPIFFAVG
jgi:hypothetical protein